MTASVREKEGGGFSGGEQWCCVKNTVFFLKPVLHQEV